MCLSCLSLGLLPVDRTLNCLEDIISLCSLEGESSRARGAAATRLKRKHDLWRVRKEGDPLPGCGAPQGLNLLGYLGGSTTW